MGQTQVCGDLGVTPRAVGQASHRLNCDLRELIAGVFEWLMATRDPEYARRSEGWIGAGRERQGATQGKQTRRRDLFCLEV